MDSIQLSLFGKTSWELFHQMTAWILKPCWNPSQKRDSNSSPRQWAHVGMVRGRKVDVCWRVLDSQYWGVPQRRRRVLLIADFRDFRAREILFNTERMQSDSENRHSDRLLTTRENRILTPETGRNIQLLVHLINSQ